MEMREDDMIRLAMGQMTPDEKKEIIAWISRSAANKEEYYRIKNLWALTSQSNEEMPADQAEVKRYKRNIRRNKLVKLKKRAITFVSYAAVLIIAFFIEKLVSPDKKCAVERELVYNEISVPAGQMAQLRLSDGTSVYINSCSKLTYPSFFNPGERRVFLSGEAYFSVTKNTTPFIVETKNRRVKVLGTKFNVMSYPKDKIYQTTLLEGKIIMLDTLSNELVELKHGEQYTFDSVENKQTVKIVKTRLFASWKDGIYIFDHETLGGLADRLERIFDVKIDIKNNRIMNYKFTGTISRNVPFEQILKIIRLSAPIHYQLKESHGAIEQVTLY
jgi:transmembrane sensor